MHKKKKRVKNQSVKRKYKTEFKDPLVKQKLSEGVVHTVVHTRTREGEGRLMSNILPGVVDPDPYWIGSVVRGLLDPDPYLNYCI